MYYARWHRHCFSLAKDSRGPVGNRADLFDVDARLLLEAGAGWLLSVCRAAARREVDVKASESCSEGALLDRY